MLSVWDEWDIKDITDNRPDDYIYALLNKEVCIKSKLQIGDNLFGNKEWIINKTKTELSGYFGAIYINYQEEHIVLVHKSTSSIKALIDNLHGIFSKQTSSQLRESFALVKEAVQLAQTLGFGLSFTGHSLGALLAELSIFYCKAELNFPNVNTVSFESPGSVESLQAMQSVFTQNSSIHLDEIDIIGYVSYPNLINTCNHQLGTLYAFNNDLGKYSQLLSSYSVMKAHPMHEIIEFFNKKSRPVRIQYIKNWPIGKQREHFFKLAELKKSFSSLTEEEVLISSEQYFKIVYESHYKVDSLLSQNNVLPLKHFNKELQKFLIIFYNRIRDINTNKTSKFLIIEALKNTGIPEKAINYLLGYKLIRCNQLLAIKLDISSEITIFRKELSKFLGKYGNNIEKFISTYQATAQQEIMTSIIASRGKLLKSGEIEDVKAIGLKIAVLEDTASESIISTKRILEQLQNGDNKITSSIIASQAKVSGHIKKAQAIGVEVDVTPANLLLTNNKKGLPGTLQNIYRLLKRTSYLPSSNITTSAIGGQKNTVSADNFSVIGQQVLLSPLDNDLSFTKLVLTCILFFVSISLVVIFIFNLKEGAVFSQHKVANKSESSVKTSKNPILLNLPPRNNKFTGREDELMQIHKQLDNKKIGIITQTIAGLGGIGKTQLATEFAYRATERQYYKAILWVTADTTSTLHNAYKKFANHLQLDTENLSFNEIQKLVHKCLAKHEGSRVLLILDNVQYYKEIKGYIDLIYEQLTNITPHILITSRSQNWPEIPLILEPFTPQEALLFIKKHLPDADDSSITNLSKLLNYFPLALSQAAAYIETHTNIDDYLRIYATKTEELLNEFSNTYDQYTGSLWKTWNISLSKLGENGQKILFISAYLAPDGIPIEFFNEMSITERMEAIEDLRKYSLITLNNNKNSFRTHRLLQEIIRLTIKKEAQWLSHAMDLIERKFDFDYLEIEKLDMYKKYLENATLIAEYAIKTKGSLLYRGIKLYAKMAMFRTHILIGGEELISVWLELMKIVKEYYKDNCNPLLIASINTHLSVANRVANNVSDAKKYADQARLIYLNNNHKITAKELELINILRLIPLKDTLLFNQVKYDLGYSLIQLGNIYNYSFHDYRNAILSYNQALENFSMLKNIDVVKHHKLDTIYNISTAYMYLGNLIEADDLLQTTKTLVDQIYPNHRQQACVYTRIATFSNYIGKFKESDQMYKEALRIFSRTLTEKHKHIISIKAGLGFNALMSGDLKNATIYLETTMPYWENASDWYYLFLSAKLHISRLYEAMGDYDKALIYAKESLEIATKGYKDQLLDSMEMQISRAEKWQQISIKTDVVYWKSMLDITTHLFGEKHYQTSRYHCLLGQSLANMKEVNRARVHYEKALYILKHEEIKHPNLVQFHKQNLHLLDKLIRQLDTKKHF